MNLSKLKTVLADAVSADADTGVTVLLPGEAAVPAHFHITEVGYVTKDFIDCGGTRRSSSACTLQTYVANDTDHRLPAKKLLGILEATSVLTQADDIDVDFECQEATISIYSLDQASFDDANNNVVLSLAAKQTDCLAKDACGIDPDAKTVAIGAGSTSGLNLLGDDAPSGACCSIDSTGST